MSNLLQEIGGFIGIIPGTTFSDHAPVSLVVCDEQKSLDVHFRIADSLVNNVHFEPRMQGIWNRFEVLRGSNVEKFAGLLLESNDMFVEEAKHKFEEYK